MSQLAEGRPSEVTETDTGTGADVDGDQASAGSSHDQRSRGRWRDRVHRIDAVLVVAIGVGAVLRFWGLGAQSLWYDEWLSAEAATGPFDDLLRYVVNQAGIPPSYFAFLWGWVRLFGDSDVALRSVSALAGIATIPLAYALALELRQRRTVARIAAALVAVNPMLVWYSQEARPYSLLALLGALSLLTLSRLWTRGGRGDLAVWLFVCAIAVSVHYFAIFLVAAEVAALLAIRWTQGKRSLPVLLSRWRSLPVPSIPAAGVLVALAPFAFRQFSQRDNHSWITAFPLIDRLNDASQVALVGPGPLHSRVWMVMAALVVLAVALVLARGDRAERWATTVAGGTSLLSVALAVGATVVGIDGIVGRYFSVFLVPLVVAVAIGLGLARVPRWFGPTAAAALCGISLVSVVAVARDPNLQRSDWRAVAEAHDDAGDTGDRLLVMNLHAYQGLPLLRYLDDGRVLDQDESVTVQTIDILVTRPQPKPCNPFVGRPCVLIYLGAPIPEPLTSQLELQERIELDQFFIDRYRAASPVTVTPADIVPPIDLSRSLMVVTE